MTRSIKAVGVDLGGTKTEVALVDEHGRILKKIRRKTSKKESEILRALVRAIREVKGRESIAGIGIGFAGFVDSKRGIVISSPNIPPIKKTRVKKFLKKRFKCKIILENDANMLALGEYLFGFKKKHSNLVALTLGTGVGSGVIVNGKLMKGKGIAAELGHTIIGSSSTKCMCGNFGCFEALVSGRAIVERARKQGLNAKSAKEVALKASRGNKAAMHSIHDTAHFLGIGMANAANAFDPEIIVLGGGLANIRQLIKAAKREMKKHVVVNNRVRVFRERLKGNGTMLGAALCAMNEFLLVQKKPLLAVDCIIETPKGIVLVKRRFEPKGWALPGGIVEFNESLEKAVRREMLEETGLELKKLEQFRAYSSPKRDPRQHSISMVFTAKGIGRIRPNEEATEIRVFPLKKVPRLAFDHARVLKDWGKEFKDG